MILHVLAIFPVENRAETCSTNWNLIIQTELGKTECILQLNFDNSVSIGTTNSAMFPVENRAGTCSRNLNVIIETELGKTDCIVFLEL